MKFLKTVACIALSAALLMYLIPINAFALGKPVITSHTDGMSLPVDDTLIRWTEAEGAEKHYVNIRYIENDGDNGPLVVDLIPADGGTYTLEREALEKFGTGAYRICISAVQGTATSYSETVTVYFSDNPGALAGKTVVFFGDSLTAAFSWCRLLSERFGFSAVNAGVGGNTTDDAMERFENDVIKKDPDIVFICFGMNDQVHEDHVQPRVSLEKFEKNMEYFVTRSLAAGAEVILLTPNCVNEEGYYGHPVHPESDYIRYGGANNFLNRYCDVTRGLASKYGLGLVDLFAEFSESDLSVYIEAAGVHPVDAGYRLYAQYAGEYLESAYGSQSTVTTTVNYKSFNGKSYSGKSLETAPGARIYLLCPTDETLYQNGIGRIYTAASSGTLNIYLTAASGDVNSDGSLGAIDCLLIKRSVLSMGSLSGESAVNADMNGDGEISAADCLIAKQMLLLGFRID